MPPGEPVAAQPADPPAPEVDPAEGRRAVWRLAGARLASTGGSQAAQVALAYTVYEQTSSAAWVSASLVASVGAVGLLGPVSGRLSDRGDRRRVMVVAEVAGGIGWLLVLLAGSPLALVLAALAATAANAPFRAASSAADGRRRRLFAVTSLAFAAFGITLVADLPLVDHFGGGSVAYALLTTLWGAGAVAGSVLAARLPRRHEPTALVGGAAAMGLSLGVLAVVPNLPLAIAVGVVGGAGDGMLFVPWYSMMQRRTPDAERGTAFAMADTLNQTAFVAGMVVAGPLVEAIGVQATYLFPGVLMIGAAVLAASARGVD